MKAERAKRPVGRGGLPKRQPERWRADDCGAVLLLAGLLLVLGFLIVAGAILTTKSIEEGAAREERRSIVRSSEALVREFNETVRKVVNIGETNLTDFKERQRLAQEGLRATAVGQGLYVDIRLDPAPDPAIYWRDARCGAFNSARSQDGVIIGYDRDTARESVVGAVYDIHVTDGRQTLRFPYYVKLYDCLATSMSVFIDDWTVVEGALTDPQNAQSATDADAAMRLEELPVGTQYVPRQVGPQWNTVTFTGWNYPEYILADDLLATQHPATPLNDYIKFKVDTSAIPASEAIRDVQIRVDAFHVAAVDDYLRLRVLDGANVMLSTPVTTGLLEQSFLFALPTSPSGSAVWTKAELSAIDIELQVIEVGMFDPPSFFHVDYVAAAYNAVLPEKYAADAEFAWPLVPTVYDSYTLEVRYLSDPPSGEAFLLEVWDGSSWNVRLTLAPTGASFTTLAHVLQPAEIDGGDLRVRVRDAVGNDADIGSNDTLRVDWLRLTAAMDPP